MTYMEKFRSSAFNLWIQRTLRSLQFLSPVISLGFFASRLYKIHQTLGRLSTSNGAVAGILSAAIVYSLAAGLVTCCTKGGPKWLRWLLVVFDILFVGAFIAVADLTRPNGGTSGPCKSRQYGQTVTVAPKGQNCNLPWATFITAIIRTYVPPFDRPSAYIMVADVNTVFSTLSQRPSMRSRTIAPRRTPRSTVTVMESAMATTVSGASRVQQYFLTSRHALL